MKGNFTMFATIEPLPANPVSDDELPDFVQANIAKRARCEVLEKAILTAAAQINASNYRFLKLLAEFDEKGGWHGDGIKSFSHWLNWKIGMGSVMGREKVRVARALVDLPLIETAFSKGEISYSKVRAMTRVATAENELFLMQIAENGTAQHMEYLVRKYALCQRLEGKHQDDDEYQNADWKQDKTFTWFQDDEGMYELKVRLPADEGAVVIKALNIIINEIQKERRDEPVLDEPESHSPSEPRSKLKVDSRNVSAESFPTATAIDDQVQAFSSLMPDEDGYGKFTSLRASALVRLAGNFLEDGGESDGFTQSSHKKTTNGSLGEKYLVFLHINTNEASRDYQINGSAGCSIGNEQFLAPQVARRLACDAQLTTILEDDAGNVLDIGRRSRIIPRAMSHALRIRDGGCRYPGCCQSTHTEAHHITHWADGGETNPGNLVTICKFHHRLLHDGEYRIHRDTSGDLVFTNKVNLVIRQSFYPQFPEDLNAQPINDPTIDEHTSECKWLGEKMDIQLALYTLFRLDSAKKDQKSEI